MPLAACTTGESSSPRPVALRLRCNVANATTTLSLGTVVTARNLSWSFGVRGPLGADGAVARASAPEGLVIRADTSLPCDAGCSPSFEISLFCSRARRYCRFSRARSRSITLTNLAHTGATHGCARRERSYCRGHRGRRPHYPGYPVALCRCSMH